MPRLTVPYTVTFSSLAQICVKCYWFSSFVLTSLSSPVTNYYPPPCVAASVAPRVVLSWTAYYSLPTTTIILSLPLFFRDLQNTLLWSSVSFSFLNHRHIGRCKLASPTFLSFHKDLQVQTILPELNPLVSCLSYTLVVSNTLFVIPSIFVMLTCPASSLFWVLLLFSCSGTAL